MHYLKQEENNKTYYCEQEEISKDKEGFIQPNKHRAIKSSATSASLIFYDEEQNRLFSKLPSGKDYQYGFIWNKDNHDHDTCIFCPTDGCVRDHDFTDTKHFTNCSEYGIDNLYKKYKQDLMKIIYRGKLANIMKFAKQPTIDLAKNVYDRLNSKLSRYNKIDKQKLDDVMKEMNKKSYYWAGHGCEQVGEKWYNNYLLYEALNGNLHTSSATNIVFHPVTRQMSFNMYNEIAIKSHDGRMYFDNLCVNIEAMNALLNVKHRADNKNITNFRSFIDACLITGGEDIVIFRNKNEQDLKQDANDNFWLKSSPMIKEKISFLEFIDKYCKDFQQHFTEKQNKKIDELRKKKMKKQTR